MKVLIVNPPREDGIAMIKEGRCMQRRDAWGYVMAPVTMVTMAGLIRERRPDIEVQVLDAVVACEDFNDALDLSAAHEADLILINTTTPTIDHDMLFATGLAARRPRGASGDASPRIAAFGIHVSVLPEQLLRQWPALDLCLIGEPEFTALELSEALADGGPLDRVPGLAWLDDGALQRTPPRPFLEDLDELPIADWSFVDLDHYRMPFDGQRFVLLNTNRGCPYRCSFCNAHVYYGRKPRQRSVPHIMAEIRQDLERFGVREIMIWAEEFILDQALVIALAEAIIDSGLDVRWVCNARVDGVSLEVLTRIKEAGCWNIAYGIESGVQEILDASEKRIRLPDTRQAVTWAKDAGLMVTGHVILGLPGETRETMAATHAFVVTLDLDYVQYYCAMPYPGTPFYEQALAAGWIQSHEWTRYEHNDCVVDYPQLSGEAIKRARTTYFLAYYLNPRILRRLARTHLDSPSHAWHFARTIKDFLAWVAKR